MTAHLSLRIIGPGVERESRHIVGPSGVSIGRDAQCDLVLPSELVSRRHATLFWADDGLRIRDRSANGTQVGETRVVHQEHAVRTRDAIGVGPYRIELGAIRRITPDVPGELSSLRRQLHRRLLDHLNLSSLDRAQLGDGALRQQIVTALHFICDGLGSASPQGAVRKQLIDELCDECLGLGPLEELLADPKVTEIMVVDPTAIYAERAGRLERTPYTFTDSDSVRAVLERIVAPLGRRIDESSPMVDARLKDGSRVNAIIPPLATRGPCLTIRKFVRAKMGFPELIHGGSITEAAARFLQGAVRLRKNIVISGGTGSGKTTLLNVLCTAIGPHERIITIEDAAELSLAQDHVVSLECRPANAEGQGEYTIRDLLRNALRMRPDRILVGECRGGEALDMLQAMNTGHEGSMTTTHANSPRHAVSRLETLCLMSGLNLPVTAIRQHLAQSVHLIVQQTRHRNGARTITHITEVAGLDDEGEVVLEDVFHLKSLAVDSTISGPRPLVTTGYLPTFVGDLPESCWPSAGSSR